MDSTETSWPSIYSSISIQFAREACEALFSACAKLFECCLLNKYHLRFNTALRFSEDVLFVLECMSCCDYISVGNKADYNYISYEGTMSKIVTPFVSEYTTFFSCKTVINQYIANVKLK